MADWTNLPNQAVGVGGLPSGTTVTALRDNPIAIAEGAAGAPLISGALTKIIDQQEIGAFIFARGGTASYGSVVAGSSLSYAGALNTASGTATNPGGGSDFALRSVSFSAGVGSSPSGSWVCLGAIAASGSASGSAGGSGTATAATLWQRVS